jgi:hypothetical protein
MAEVDPDQQAALRRLRAAFGVVEILRLVDNDDGQDQDDDKPSVEGEQAATPAQYPERPHSDDLTVGTERRRLMGVDWSGPWAGVLLSDEEAMQIIAVLADVLEGHDVRDAVTRWRKTLRGIAVEEMLHLALVSNLMAAIGAAPVFGRPNFPQRSRYFPSWHAGLSAPCAGRCGRRRHLTPGYASRCPACPAHPGMPGLWPSYSSGTTAAARRKRRTW